MHGDFPCILTVFMWQSECWALYSETVGYVCGFGTGDMFSSHQIAKILFGAFHIKVQLKFIWSIFFFGVIIELLSFVACRRYGFSRQSKTEKVRNAWLMGEHIWDMEVCFYFASVWHWQAHRRDGTQGSGPWAIPVSRGVPAAFDPCSSLLVFPICCLCRLGSCDNSSSWDWKWRVVENHGPGVKHVGFNNSKVGAWASSSDERCPKWVWTACWQWERARCTLQAGHVLSLEWKKVKVGLYNFIQESQEFSLHSYTFCVYVFIRDS